MTLQATGKHFVKMRRPWIWDGVRAIRSVPGISRGIIVGVGWAILAFPLTEAVDVPWGVSVGPGIYIALAILHQKPDAATVNEISAYCTGDGKSQWSAAHGVWAIHCEEASGSRHESTSSGRTAHVQSGHEPAPLDLYVYRETRDVSRVCVKGQRII